MNDATKGLILSSILRNLSTELGALSAFIKEVTDVPEVPWTRDISRELETNPGPYTSEYLQRDGGWWKRELRQIDCLTFHHTLSDSPHATAKHYVNKGGGRPTIPYTVWIAQTGEVLLCVPLEEGLWHDHTGHENTHLSVGLAGKLHLYSPAVAQLDAATGVALWAISSPTLPSIDNLTQIKGHMDFAATQCPGWNSAESGYWKKELYQMIRERAGGL